MNDPTTWLYLPIEPYNTGRLQVSPVHEIYFEKSGDPSGKSVVFLHGGPGGGSGAPPRDRTFKRNLGEELDRMRTFLSLES